MSKAAATRLNILQKAFELVYQNGYQGTSIDLILTQTKVTKGAFFYHFKNKEEMGLAMIREVMYPGMQTGLIQPLLEGEDPVTEIYTMMHGLLLENPFFQVKYGCPAINLIEEMAPLNADFHTALATLVLQWQEAIEKTLKKGKAAQQIRKEVNTAQVAFFVMSGYSGVRNLGKLYGQTCYHKYLKELKTYLKNLR
ncbi:TetR/AcrR family transcriptional regulator [Chitinophaga nivalis]|uniref:TetR/AcrR family transcriptional regulator n=1 Tax=Chitinophaga nivalis TaxID=2991709 RepID=A0ABT3IQS3_9BACT|nr:TetR/AcrR family transcriptional regulator [Chitinophaga nivalis]MCW3463991.1 TetR/AcrR family transcriptional regulator [Chitinophaga nivalis]MCW3486319.1 TetR/AcrR family transcriptional regulator [Chitinophaga nivalis]